MIVPSAAGPLLRKQWFNPVERLVTQFVPAPGTSPSPGQGVYYGASEQRLGELLPDKSAWVIVTKVGEKVLIEVSIGSDDGLRKGHTLEVFRNQSYLGRVVVKSLQPDRAVCEIIPEYRKGIIKRGDRVATRIIG